MPAVAQVGQRDLLLAVQDGVITRQQAQALWARWAGQASAVPPVARPATVAPASGPRFSFTNTLYYFGGLVAIGAMTLFLRLSWDAFGPWGLMLLSAAYLLACLKVADHLASRQLRVPAGILATLAVVLTPLVVWCFQHGMGWWPPGGPLSYSAYHTHINWRWLTLELVTLAAGVVMLWRKNNVMAPMATMPPK